MDKNNNALFYTCSLIEFIARETNNKRNDIINFLGNDLERIYEYQDVFHVEPIEKVADDFINRNNIPNGEYDNISICKYRVPSYWDIGEVFERLIEDLFEEKDLFKGIREVYSSWLAEEIFNFNSDLYYQSRYYIAEGYRVGYIIDGWYLNFLLFS